MTERLTSLICATEPMNAVWSSRATLQRMLDVEAALARASAAHGVIPVSAVPAIVAACDAGQLDAQALARDAALGGNLAIPLVKQLTARVKSADPEASKYVHWGATSQDIIDTATVLQLRDALGLIEGGLDALCATLAALARTHRATPAVGRTWLQQALPITLGLKFAQWLDALLRHRERLAALRERAEAAGEATMLPATPVAPVEPAVEQRAHPLIMVVDDSITMRKVTTRVLERNDMDVVTAKDGLDAVEKLQDKVPDIMLLDVEMPRMDGYELATYMKNDPRLKHVPIIMITSRTGEKHRQRAFEIGVERYLGKPYQEADLLRNVQETLSAKNPGLHRA